MIIIIIITIVKSPLLLEPKFLYGFHERQPLTPLLRLINPVQNITVNFFKTNIGVIPKFGLPVLLDFPIKILHACLISTLRAICSVYYVL